MRAGQFCLPVESMTTQDFLLQILRGEKKVILNKDVRAYNLPSGRFTTKKRLIMMIAGQTEILKYFPDKIDKQADKEFIVNIINTLDPAFFPSIANEIDEQMLKMKKKEDVIELTPEMHHFIMQMQNLPANRNPHLGKGTLRIAKQPRKQP